MKPLSPLPFPRNIRVLFALFGIFLAGNRAGSQVQGVESNFDKYYFIHTTPGPLPVKNFRLNIFQFCGCRPRRTFQIEFKVARVVNLKLVFTA